MYLKLTKMAPKPILGHFDTDPQKRHFGHQIASYNHTFNGNHQSNQSNDQSKQEKHQSNQWNHQRMEAKTSFKSKKSNKKQRKHQKPLVWPKRRTIISKSIQTKNSSKSINSTKKQAPKWASYSIKIRGLKKDIENRKIQRIHYSTQNTIEYP